MNSTDLEKLENLEWKRVMDELWTFVSTLTINKHDMNIQETVRMKENFVPYSFQYHL